MLLLKNLLYIGSNDNNNYEQIGTYISTDTSIEDIQENTFLINNPNAYRYYKLVGNSSLVDDFNGLSELQYYGIKVANNKFQYLLSLINNEEKFNNMQELLGDSESENYLKLILKNKIAFTFANDVEEFKNAILNYNKLSDILFNNDDVLQNVIKEEEWEEYIKTSEEFINYLDTKFSKITQNEEGKFNDGTASTNNVYDNNHKLEYAFDGNNNTAWIGNGTSGNYVIFKFNNQVNLRWLYLRNVPLDQYGNYASIKNFDLYGSKDGESYQLIGKYSMNDTEAKKANDNNYFYIDNNEKFLSYKIKATSSVAGDYNGLSRLQYYYTD